MQDYPTGRYPSSLLDIDGFHVKISKSMGVSMKFIMTFLLAAVTLFPIPSQGEMREVKVGVFTTDPKRITDEGKVMEYLSRKVGVRFVVVPVIGYERSVEKLASGGIDAGIFGSAPAFISIKRGVAEPIARPEARKSSVYYGYWLTLKGSGLRNIKDFKGKRFAYVDPFTSAGYLFPRAAIKEKGFDPERFFGSVKFSKTHEASIQMLLNGTVDGCAAKDTAYKKFIDTNIELKDRLVIVDVDGPFPERSLVISKRVDEAVRRKVREALLEMDGDPEGKRVLAEAGRDRYVETADADFAAIERILKTLEVHK
jgi:phosphonate transport system substrate-binding protein